MSYCTSRAWAISASTVAGEILEKEEENGGRTTLAKVEYAKWDDERREGKLGFGLGLNGLGPVWCLDSMRFGLDWIGWMDLWEGP